MRDRAGRFRVEKEREQREGPEWSLPGDGYYLSRSGEQSAGQSRQGRAAPAWAGTAALRCAMLAVKPKSWGGGGGGGQTQQTTV